MDRVNQQIEIFKDSPYLQLSLRNLSLSIDSENITERLNKY